MAGARIWLNPALCLLELWANSSTARIEPEAAFLAQPVAMGAV